MKPISVAESPAVANNQGLDAHRLFSSDEVEVVHIHLPAGKSLVRHAVSVNTLFYIVTGTATIDSDAGKTEAGAGSIVPHPGNTFHRITNETGERLEFLVIRAPRPTKPPVFDH